MAKKQAKAKITGKVDAKKWVEEHGYPEVGDFNDRKDLQRFYKQLSDEQLLEWVELEGLEVKPTDSKPIYRMRLAMSILYKHFPKPPSKKKQSPYRKYSLEDLVELAATHDVPVEPTDDDRILRMRTIMALREAGVLD